ncbi:MAG TPA: hypothetical protein VF133_11725 [Terriglobales bacterium]
MADSINSKIERAKEHVRDLKVALDAFPENRNFLRRKKNADGDEIVYVKFVPEVPGRIPTIIGDILYNLRCALDYLAFGLVTSNPACTSKKDIHFPFGESLNDYMASERRGKIEKFCPKGVDRIDALQPYKGGNDLLWQLCRLNNIDKHRLLISAAMRYKFRNATPLDYQRMVDVIGGGTDRGGILSLITHTNFGGPIEPLKVGDEIYTKPRSLEHQKEMEFTFEVAFNEPKVIDRQPVFTTMYQMLKLVESIIPKFADLM